MVQLFAVFHDSRRTNEGTDDGHGKRGAELTASFRNKWFTITDVEFDLLHAACVGHTDGETDADITIQTCWDSDRLDLGRVSICPEPRWLCTMAAKRPEIMKWADGRGCLEIISEIVNQDWRLDAQGWRNE